MWWFYPVGKRQTDLGRFTNVQLFNEVEKGFDFPTEPTEMLVFLSKLVIYVFVLW